MPMGTNFIQCNTFSDLSLPTLNVHFFWRVVKILYNYSRAATLYNVEVLTCGCQWISESGNPAYSCIIFDGLNINMHTERQWTLLKIIVSIKTYLVMSNLELLIL